MRGDGVRRYKNGASRQRPYRALLHIEETGALDTALYNLKALATALGRADNRHDAAVAARAIERLFERDRYERTHR